MLEDDGLAFAEGLAVFDFVLHDFVNCMLEVDGHAFGERVAVFDYVLRDFVYCMLEDDGHRFGERVAVFARTLLPSSPRVWDGSDDIPFLYGRLVHF
mmetsp:Transcript_40863/g.94094  ORF Transcript_40863/g.94094 Transcript_40863/m.94094 type:complete len:97 (-) Transcript_40863:422-712(-)